MPVTALTPSAATIAIGGVDAGTGVNLFTRYATMDPKTSPFSVGTLWLSNHESVPATETVLVFVPTPNTPAKK